MTRIGVALIFSGILAAGAVSVEPADPGAEGPLFAAPVRYITSAQGGAGLNVAAGRYEISRRDSILIARADGVQCAGAACAAPAELTILLADPDGTLNERDRHDLWDGANGLVVCDLNGDGKNEVAVTSLAGSVAGFEGNGDGTVSGSFSDNLDGVTAATRVDLRGDGADDLVTANAIVPRPLRSIFGYPHGGISGGFDVSLPPGEVAWRLGSGDFNRDGAQDVVVATQGSVPADPGYNLVVLLGDGTGHLSIDSRAGLLTVPESMTVADFNRDGLDDVAVNEPYLGIAVFLNGGGYFGSASRIPSGGLGSMVAGDFNADGTIDLAENGPDGLSVFPGGGDGTFGVPTRYDSDPSGAVAAGDFDGDGRLDVAVGTSSGVTVLFNTGPFADADHDGIPDPLDSCTDRDGDGYGDAYFPANTCPLDDCPSIANPGQENADGDSLGDACDHCPADFLDQYGNDFDEDGICDSSDDCPSGYDPEQLDGDGDGFPDACDNCMTVFNPDQADSNQDRQGDACQPRLSIRDIREDGGDVLEVSAGLSDPNGDRLFSQVQVYQIALITVRNPGHDHLACDMDAMPGYGDGTGIGYEYVPGIGGILFDIDSRLGCQDGVAEYEFALGTCDNPQTEFATSVVLPAPDPYTKVCVGYPGYGPQYDLPILRFDEVSLTAHGGTSGQGTAIGVSDSGLPGQLDLPDDMVPGTVYELLIFVTDQQSNISAFHPFFYRGERVIQFTVVNNAPPVARIAASSSVECSGPAGGTVVLDGSGSSDPDSTPQANDIASYEWLENPGAADQALLGTGPILNRLLPLGNHEIALRVTDTQGQTSSAQTTVRVVDTTPPAIGVTSSPSVLWPPNHRMVPVQVTVQVSDRCDPAAAAILAAVTSSEPDDASSSRDGNTTDDIRDATASAFDTTVSLRAERSGDGPGRVYTLTYSARDSSGNTASALGIVTVPHDEGTGPEPVFLSVEGDGTAGAAHVYWSAAGGAEMYDVIRGDLSQVSQSNREISLGAVNVLASGLTAPSYSEPSSGAIPAPGRAFFYLVQYRGGQTTSGWGTESGPWPAGPASCDIGCPGAPAAPAVTSMTSKRK